MINYVTGDIFDYVKENDIVLHQVNCQGIMGGGIALQIKNMFPNVYETYKAYCEHMNKECLGDMVDVKTNKGGINFTIGNCFGQDKYGGNTRQTDYDALHDSFVQVKWNSDLYNRILIPYGIGCGLAGGDWNVVSNIIEGVFKDCNVLIVKYNK